MNGKIYLPAAISCRTLYLRKRNSINQIKVTLRLPPEVRDRRQVFHYAYFNKSAVCCLFREIDTRLKTVFCQMDHPSFS